MSYGFTLLVRLPVGICKSFEIFNGFEVEFNKDILINVALFALKPGQHMVEFCNFDSVIFVLRLSLKVQ